MGLAATHTSSVARLADCSLIEMYTTVTRAHAYYANRQWLPGSYDALVHGETVQPPGVPQFKLVLEWSTV